MSVTRTSSSTELRSHSTLLITAIPTKRQRLDANGREIQKVSSSLPSSSSIEDEDNAPKNRNAMRYTHAQLLQWTLSHDAVARCFAKDIYSAVECDGFANDFYWIGRVPCRTVHVVGLCVGVEQRDDATFFHIDDGTATIECILRHLKTPKSPKPKASKTKGKARAEPPKAEIHTPPPPVASVGNTVRVIGKIARGRGSRVLRADEGNLVVCHANEEFAHWKEVTRLHNEWYDVEEPFVIPSAALKPMKEVANRLPIMPSSPIRDSSPSRLISSPGRSSSPTKAAAQPSAPPRLRHPSKLRSRDLTANTFRIYVKHYMDNAPPYCHAPGNRPRHQDYGTSSQSTLMHRSCTGASYASCLCVPRSFSSNLRHSELTSSQDPTDPEDDGRAYGFTLGYLRRVPILSFLAQAVVQAERKRRERGPLKSDASRSRTNSKKGETSTSSAVLTSSALGTGYMRQSQERTALKTKRLFMKAIRDLYAEGSIIISEGPVRSWRYASSENDLNDRHSSQLWSASADASSNTTAGTQLSSISTEIRGSHDDDLSDPEENEEGYVPVTSKTVAPLVEQAMRYFARRTKKLCDPTAKDIIERIRAVDERYKNLGEWTVNEALEYLEREDLVERLVRGRWVLQSVI